MVEKNPDMCARRSPRGSRGILADLRVPAVLGLHDRQGAGAL